MNVSKTIKLVVLLSLAVSLQAVAGSATPSSILVVPARARMVQLAFQVSAVQDVGLVCYDTSAISTDILIHVWNGHEWIRISADEYSNGAFMAGTAKDVFILGPANAVPPLLTADPVWGKNTHRIAVLDTASIMNELGKTIRFSPRQWKWLAEKNGLTLTDNNAERRRYGRWGKSGVDTSLIQGSRAVKPAAAPLNDVIIMPPSAPVTEPAPATDVKAPAPVPAPIAPVIVTPPASPVVEPPAAAPAPVAPAKAPAAAAPVVDPTTK